MTPSPFTQRGEGRDPFPGRLRTMLALGRIRGESFQTAWAGALECYPAPPDWVHRQVGGLGEDRVTPLEFAKRVFAHAYARIHIAGDVRALAADDRVHPERDEATGDGEEEGPAPCGWGRPLCDEPATEGGRFCPEHGARLAAIRADMEQSATVNKTQAMPNGGLGRRPDAFDVAPEPDVPTDHVRVLG